MADGEASRKDLNPSEGRVSESGSGANALLEIRMRVPVQCQKPSRCCQKEENSPGLVNKILAVYCMK